MGPQTIQQLLALNRRFYQVNAQTFAARREHPWPGWTRIWLQTAPTSVLDVGCGHGRFAQFLANKNPEIKYLGVDFSSELLALAPPLPKNYKFQLAELSEPLQWEQQFALVTAFGVMHHLPSAQLRAQIFKQLSHQVAPGGWLAVTFWSVEKMPRWERLVLPWTLAEQEPGDYLLSFAGDPCPRYCHHTSENEVDALARSIQWSHERWDDDGFNRYLLLRRPD